MSKTNFEILKSVLASALADEPDAELGIMQDFPAYDPREYEAEGVYVELNMYPIFVIGGLAAAFFLLN